MIPLLKKGGRHVCKELDNYSPITLLNTELKILAQVQANHLQLVISDLIRPEQNYTVKVKSMKDNLHLLKDGIKATLINSDQSKSFNRVDNWFFGSVLETTGFHLEFHKWWCR